MCVNIQPTLQCEVILELNITFTDADYHPAKLVHNHIKLHCIKHVDIMYKQHGLSTGCIGQR